MIMKSITIALADAHKAFELRHLVFMLGWQDIKQRYRRSKIGPFWLTLSMGIMVSMIGLIFGQALKLPMETYLPYLASGIIFWNFISTSVNEGASSFISSAGMIRQLGLPLTIYPSKVLWRNVVVLGHNLIILPIAMLVVGKPLTINIFFLIPGFLVLLAVLLCLTIALGVICTRFRDMPPIVSSLTQVFFYLTPIIWMPDSVNARVSTWLVQTNPFYHLLELVRAPIMGYCPNLISWIIACGSLIGLMIITLVFFGTYRKRIAYWI